MEADRPVSQPLDITDVPSVAPAELAIALRFVAGRRQTLLAELGVPGTELVRAELAFWQRVAADPSRKLAVMLRFRSLASVLRARRIAVLVSRHGASALPVLLETAARSRLNATWGFNPSKFLWELNAALTTMERDGRSLFYAERKETTV